MIGSTNALDSHLPHPHFSLTRCPPWCQNIFSVGSDRHTSSKTTYHTTSPKYDVKTPTSRDRGDTHTHTRTAQAASWNVKRVRESCRSRRSSMKHSFGAACANHPFPFIFFFILPICHRPSLRHTIILVFPHSFPNFPSIILFFFWKRVVSPSLFTTLLCYFAPRSTALRSSNSVPQTKKKQKQTKTKCLLENSCMQSRIILLTSDNLISRSCKETSKCATQ